MERKPPKPMTPFDSMVTPPYLYSLKLMLPYTPQSMQRFMAIYIKFLELRHTMEYFHGFSSHGPSFRIIDELKPFMEPGEKEMMEQMEAMMNMIEMMQGMQEMSEAASQNTDGSASQGFGAFNPMDLMKGMLSPDQQEMFNTYSSMFDEEMNQANSDNQKGESDNE